jgi:dephospho-CoA kinase
MIVIGITGSIASGKTTVAKLISKKKYPLFSADKIVSDLYKKTIFIKLLSRKFNLNSRQKVKNQIKLIIKADKNKLKTLESVIHPLVRKKMKNFLKLKNKILVLEVPLLTENKLNKYFDKIIFVDAKKSLRLKRYSKHNKEKKIFEILNKRQLSSTIKKKTCDLTINNNYSLVTLKKNIKKFIKTYE